MKVPETKYATRDGLSIAYQQFGTGPDHLVVLNGAAAHVELNWMLTPYATFMERLGTIVSVIVFDKAGTGLSDPVAGVPTLDERVDDVLAVLDAVGIERAALLGFSEGAPTAALFAATYPSRCSQLILYGAVTKGAEITNFLDRLLDAWGRGRSLEVFGGEVGRIAGAMTPRASEFGGLYERAAASPAMMRAVIEAAGKIDITPVLPAVNVPTLVMHRVDEPIPVSQARQAAARIPGAKLVELEGDSHHPWFGDTETVFTEIEQFLTGKTSVAPVSDRILAVLLFTDVVRSTEIVTEMGDGAWSSLLDRWESAVRDQIERHRGREVFTKGDEFFVAFDGPARAAQCAVAIRDVSNELGLGVRTGIHIGECEARGSDLAGVAVHTAARVMGEARANEILATSTIRDLAAGAGVRFDDRGSTALRGVPGEWRLWAIEHVGIDPLGDEGALTASEERRIERMSRVTQWAPRLARRAERWQWGRAAKRADRDG